jgi:hypothetical protein
MKKRSPHIQTPNTKVRAKVMPRAEKIIRSWDANGWAYELAQRPTGVFVVYAVEIDGDGWRVESGDTVKAAMKAMRESDADVLNLLSVSE